jgi:hypothetical protein
MTRISGRRTTLKAVHICKPGLHSDGEGLYVQIANPNSKSWIFRYA